jgi:hypothetical protein
MNFYDYILESEFCFASTKEDSYCEFLSKSYCFVGCKIYTRSWILTHRHIVYPSILSINQKMNHCAKKPSFDCADIAVAPGLLWRTFQ